MFPDMSKVLVHSEPIPDSDLFGMSPQVRITINYTTVDPKQFVFFKRNTLQLEFATSRAGRQRMQGRGGNSSRELGDTCKIKDCKAEVDTAV